MNKELESYIEKMNFNQFYDYLKDEEIGDWDSVNSEEIIKQYITNQMNQGIPVSHILEALEKHPSEQELYRIWLGNSMETPTPINTKQDLIEALGVDLK